jgi:hypothetical protein
MAAYFSIIVIDPRDWEEFLDSRDSLPAVLTCDPAEAQDPTFTGAANATLQEFYFRSDTGYPEDSTASITILVDSVDEQGKEHRETLHYVGRVIGGEAFRFDQRKYPLRTKLY